MAQRECQFYDNFMLDLSMFQYLYSGVDCQSYGIANEEFTYIYDSVKAKNVPLFNMAIGQSRLYYHNVWTRTSFDAILGLIGGFVGLIWLFTTWLLGGYEEFRFNQEIISEIYSTTDATRMMADVEPTT